jgi:GNAT superfamily N-acetyltransferase
MWQIRKCTAADFDRVSLLLKQLWPSKATDSKRLRLAWDRALASTSQRLVSAVDQGEIVGFCSMSIKNSLWCEGPLAQIDELIVTERARGLGIGAALLDFMRDMAEKFGCARIEADGTFQCEESQGFYEHGGFEQRSLLLTMGI